MKVLAKLKNIFYKSFLGGFYLEFLLFLDRRFNKVRRLSPKEITQVIRSYSQINEGVTLIKKRLNPGLLKDDKDSNEEFLNDLKDIAPLAERPFGEQYKIVEVLRNRLDFSNTDIKTSTDRAKMIEQRIQDYKKLHEHKKARQALREARRNKNNGK